MMVSWKMCRIHTFRTDEGMTANMNQRMGEKISTRLEKGIIPFTCISFFEFLFLLVRSGSYYLLPRILGSPLNRFPFFSLSLPQFIPKHKPRGYGTSSGQVTSLLKILQWSPVMLGIQGHRWLGSIHFYGLIPISHYEIHAQNFQFLIIAPSFSQLSLGLKF